MTRQVLLVTGSRLFADDENAAFHFSGSREVRAQLVAMIDLLDPLDVVLSGGARGPDTWACEIAGSHGVRWVKYLPSGVREADTCVERLWSPHSVHPLARNDRLIKACLRAQSHGWTVRVAGFVHPGAKTGGTGYTLRKAKEAGLRPERFTLLPDGETLERTLL